MTATEASSIRADSQHFSSRELLFAAWNLFLVGLLFVTCFSFFAGWSPYAELLCNFRVQYAVGAGLAFVVCLTVRQWRLAWLPAAALVANLWVLGPYFLPVTAPSVAGTTHRAMLLNLYVWNTEHELVRALVRDEQPDFIVFSELTPTWLTALEPLHEQYPHRLLPLAAELHTDLHLGLFSKHPLRDSQREPLSDHARPRIEAWIELGAQPLWLHAIHPRTPVSDWGVSRRNAELRALADRVATRPQAPTLLLGDLNVSNFSPAFAALVARSGLRDSQLDFGLQRSWPTGLYPARIPIDHCLTSPGVVLKSRRLGPNVGSDHFPVLVDFALRAD
ncbi:MAG: endonuclease/exonuclease/phosphatase family protein [Planctomycetia bacterium]|nr:endonuclease/exonuclease/phosphatase family protein [Planctomycetia bacterium]